MLHKCDAALLFRHIVQQGHHSKVQLSRPAASKQASSASHQHCCTTAPWVQIEQDLESIANSEHFFLFEESLRAVLLAVSRDTELGASCCHKPFPTLLGRTAARETSGRYPPSGLLPCR